MRDYVESFVLSLPSEWYRLSVSPPVDENEIYPVIFFLNLLLADGLELVCKRG